MEGIFREIFSTVKEPKGVSTKLNKKQQTKQKKALKGKLNKIKKKGE